MKRKINWLSFFIILFGAVFIIALSLFHFSNSHFKPDDYVRQTQYYLGVQQNIWDMIWAISQTSLSLLMGIIGAIYSYGIVQKFIKYNLIPYFAVTLVYVISCYTGIRFWDVKVWECIWAFICFGTLLSGLIYFLPKTFKDAT